MINTHDIIKAVSLSTHETVGAITSNREHDDLVRARLAVIEIARENTKLSYPQIGRALNRHHSTLIKLRQRRAVKTQHEQNIIDTARSLLRASFPNRQWS